MSACQASALHPKRCKSYGVCCAYFPTERDVCHLLSSWCRVVLCQTCKPQDPKGTANAKGFRELPWRCGESLPAAQGRQLEALPRGRAEPRRFFISLNGVPGKRLKMEVAEVGLLLLSQFSPLGKHRTITSSSSRQLEDSRLKTVLRSISHHKFFGGNTERLNVIHGEASCTTTCVPHNLL